MTMFYKAIGFLVWKTATFYLRQKLPPRRALLGGAAAVGVVTVLAVGAKRGNGD
jgi:hypothetical protein